ncbi:hypothetical protein KRP22_004394 [Phytophthora ramorum]|nr:hypothetical protein KRP22_13497 [Phytophthora ramorum]
MPAEQQAPRHGATLATETFRSPRVFEQIDQVEKSHQSALPHPRPRLTPEEAFNNLRRAVLAAANSGKSATLDAVAARDMLTGLEAACWQPFIQQKSAGQHPRILYSQLLRGTEEILREEQAECQRLRDEIQQLEERNNHLPQKIQECQAAVARAMESAVRGDSLLDQKPTDTDVSATTATIREELTKMRRRKDLRTFACNELRTGLNDLLTRRSELKQLVSVAICDVKKEEQANKLRAKRLDDLRTLTTAASLLPTGRVGSKNSTQQQLARLTLAIAKNHVLQEARTERKTFVRNRTEAIFEVRIALGQLNNERITVQADLQNLEQQAEHLQRAFTPRPDWSELHDATVVRTAVDRVDPSARLRMGATRNKLAGAKAGDVEEDRANEQRLTHILSSNWSTIAKVGAMAAELVQIRSHDHAGDTILTEQKKLKHLRKEIERLMQQLEAVKAQTA